MADDAKSVRDPVRLRGPAASGFESAPGLPWLTQAGDEVESRLSLGGLLKQAWGLFQVDRLDEAEKTAELVVRLEPLTTWSTASTRSPSEAHLLSHRRKPPARLHRGTTHSARRRRQRLADEAADLFADPPNCSTSG